jgi:hypothetical protein
MTANLPPQQSRGQAPRPTSSARRLFSRVAALIAECDYAQRRWVQLKLSPESYAMQPDRGPDSYAEFLYRASGSTWHEPSARERESCGRGVS